MTYVTARGNNLEPLRRPSLRLVGVTLSVLPFYRSTKWAPDSTG